MKIRDSAVLLLCLGLGFAPLRVSAQGAAAPAGDEKAANLKRAEELYRNGERLYTEGSYESAILAFQESYELSKEPQLLYNIGNAYERLGDFGNARRYLDQYRAFAPEKEREALSRRIQTLDQRQREKEQKERDAAAAAVEKNNTPAQPVTTTPADPGKRDAGAPKLLYLNNNLHSVHHAVPGLPWYRIPALWRAERAQFLAGNGEFHWQGYGGLLWRHLFTPIDSPGHPGFGSAEGRDTPTR